MERDLRQTSPYREVEEHFRRLFEPSFGRISGADDPAPSPDGRTLAFTGSKIEKFEGSPVTRVCTADVESGEIREITHGPNSDRAPRWSPDGRRLAFLSDRAAGSGVTGTNGDEPSWMPSVEAHDDSGTRRRLDVLDVEAGSVRTVSPDALNAWEAVWCGPDRIAAVVTNEPGEDAWYGARVVLLDVESGQARDLYATGRPDRQMAWPAGSPSGQRVAVVRGLASDREVVAGDVVLVDTGSGRALDVDTAGCDVTWLSWRDEDHLFYAGQRGLETVAGEISVGDAGTPSATELWANHESFGQRYPQAEPFGDGFVAVLESHDRAPEIAVWRDGKPRTVASFAHDGTRWLTEAGGRLEQVEWTAPDGRDIQGLLVVPEGPGPHALLVHVHGGPVWAYRNRWAMGSHLTPLLVTRGYAVLHPNPRGSSGVKWEPMAHRFR